MRGWVLTCSAFLLTAALPCAVSAQGPDFDGDGFDDLVIGVEAELCLPSSPTPPFSACDRKCY